MNTTKLTLAAMLVCGAASAQAMPLHLELYEPMQMIEAVSAPQVKDDLLAGSEKFSTGAKEVSEVNMDSKSLGLVGKDSEMARKMDFIVVRSYTYEKAGMYQQADMDVFRNRLQDGTWSCMIHTKDKDGSTDICMRSSADKESNEMIIMTAEAKEVTFVHLKGRMPLDELGKMGEHIPLPPAPLKKH